VVKSDRQVGPRNEKAGLLASERRPKTVTEISESASSPMIGRLPLIGSESNFTRIPIRRLEYLGHPQARALVSTSEQMSPTERHRPDCIATILTQSKRPTSLTLPAFLDWHALLRQLLLIAMGSMIGKVVNDATPLSRQIASPENEGL
jgi:hypothetical protein